MALPEVCFPVWGILFMCLWMPGTPPQNWVCSLWRTPFQSPLLLSLGSPQVSEGTFPGWALSPLTRPFWRTCRGVFIYRSLGGSWLFSDLHWVCLDVPFTFCRWYKLILQKGEKKTKTKPKSWVGIGSCKPITLEGERMWKHTPSLFSPGKESHWCEGYCQDKNPQHDSSVLPHALTMGNSGDTCSGTQPLLRDFAEAEEMY